MSKFFPIRKKVIDYLSKYILITTDKNYLIL